MASGLLLPPLEHGAPSRVDLRDVQAVQVEAGVRLSGR
jgi:hypothetical protein